VAATVREVQLVGLEIRFGRSIVSASVRMSSGIPRRPAAEDHWRSSAGRCADRSRRSRARRPCRGPRGRRARARRCSTRTARPTDWIPPEGRSLRGMGPSGRPRSPAGRRGQVERVGAGPRPTVAVRSPRPAGNRPGMPSVSGQSATPPRIPESPAGSFHGEGAEALFAILARERQRERARRARLVVQRSRRERGAEAPARARAAAGPRVDFEFAVCVSAACTPRHKLRARRVGATRRRGREQRPFAAVEAQPQLADRQLREVRERDGQPAGLRVACTFPRA